MLRLVQNGSPAAQASSSEHVQSWMGLHFRGHCLQPRTYAETAGLASSIRLTQGSCVSGGSVRSPPDHHTRATSRTRALQISPKPVNPDERLSGPLLFQNTARAFRSSSRANHCQCTSVNRKYIVPEICRSAECDQFPTWDGLAESHARPL